MKPVIARHRISRNPDGKKEFTGKFDNNGEPIIRTLPERFLPGMVLIPTDEDELAYFTDLGAVRTMTEMELVMYEDKGQTSGFPTDVRDA